LIEFGDGFLAFVQAGVEFAFAKAQDVGAQFQAFFVEGGHSGAVALLNKNAALAFLERLHPKGLRDVGDGFGEAVKGCGAGVEPCRQGFPPGIEQGIDGVGGAFADFGADFFDGGADPFAQERVGCVGDVTIYVMYVLIHIY